MTLITADGLILTVNDEMNTDLFWAIRGGGSNFGIVTEFVYRLHPQRRNVYAGLLIFPANALDRLIPVINDWWADGFGPSEKEAVLHLLTRRPDRTVNLFESLLVEPKSDIFLALRSCDPLYNGTEEEGRANFKQFLDLGIAIRRFSSYHEAHAVFIPRTYRRYDEGNPV